MEYKLLPSVPIFSSIGTPGSVIAHLLSHGSLLHVALHMFTHILQVNMCFLYVQTRRIHCYICQVLLYDKYIIY